MKVKPFASGFLRCMNYFERGNKMEIELSVFNIDNKKKLVIWLDISIL